MVDIQLCKCRDRTELSTIPSFTRSTVYRPYSKPNTAINSCGQFIYTKLHLKLHVRTQLETAADIWKNIHRAIVLTLPHILLQIISTPPYIL